MARADVWVENRPSRGLVPGLRVRELVAYRELVLLLALRDIQLRYKQTFFGVLWAVLQPLAMAGLFTLILGKIADFPSDGLPYALFAYAGFVAWTYHSTSVEAAARSLTEDESLVTKVFFPRLLAPLAAVLPGLLDWCISGLVLAVAVVVAGASPGLALLTLPLWVAAIVLFAFGAGAFFAALNVRYRDVRYAFTFVLQVWLFASPVFYPVSALEGTVRWIYSLNPLVGLLDGFRWAALGGPAPHGYDVLSLASGAVLFVAGIAYFQSSERRFADLI